MHDFEATRNESSVELLQNIITYVAQTSMPMNTKLATSNFNYILNDIWKRWQHANEKTNTHRKLIAVQIGWILFCSNRYQRYKFHNTSLPTHKLHRFQHFPVWIFSMVDVTFDINFARQISCYTFRICQHMRPYEALHSFYSNDSRILFLISQIVFFAFSTC